MNETSSKPMSPALRFFFSRILPLIFIVAGVSVAYFGFRGLVRAKASLDWPSAPGKIIASSVEKHRSSRSNGRSSTTYHAEIRYAFSVDGRSLTGSRVAYGDYGSSDPDHAREIAGRYPVGKPVTVYYMPENPEESLLEPGLKWQAWMMPAFGLVFFFVGGLMAVLLPKAMAKVEGQAAA